MRGTQVSLALSVKKRTPSEPVFNMQNPAGWPAIAGHDGGMDCIDASNQNYRINCAIACTSKLAASIEKWSASARY